jgi:3D (Asp-Asp-Asp) domain-containing protein
MPNKTLSDCMVREYPKRHTIVRNGVVLLCALAIMQLVATKSAEVTDSRIDRLPIKLQIASLSAPLFDGARFLATAYSYHGITRSGLPVAPGLAAADPRVLPLGSLIHVDVPRYRGIYQVMDTGRLIKGKRIDLYIPSYKSALEFGAQKVNITVLRRGYVWQGPEMGIISRLEQTPVEP